MAKNKVDKTNIGTRLNHGIIGLLINTVRSFSQARAAEAAASIAYYALFSLFPLLLFLVVLGGSILERAQIQQQILGIVKEVLPASEDLVARNIQQVVRFRGAVGIIGLVGLLWSATAVFSALVRNINRAWHTAPPRNFLVGRLMALSMVGMLAVLLLLSYVATPAIRVLAHFDFLQVAGVPVTPPFAWAIFSRLIPCLITFLIFQGLYRWIPNTDVKWSDAFWGALVATTAWEFTKAGFSWYLSSGFASQRLVYGSLGAVIALLLWVYLTAFITLFGAHLSAAITHRNRSGNSQKGAMRRPSAR